MSKEPTTIYPLVFGADTDHFTDFGPNPVPVGADDEEAAEEAADPKDESAQEPAPSPGSNQIVEPPAEVTPVPPPATKGNTPPKVPVPGS